MESFAKLKAQKKQIEEKEPKEEFDYWGSPWTPPSPQVKVVKHIWGLNIPTLIVSAVLALIAMYMVYHFYMAVLVVEAQ
jgi:hypothetical protein